MGRLLGLVLLAFLIWLCLRALRRFLQAPEAPKDARSLPVETLVRCAACGVYVSGERTLPGERGGAYCSEACRRQAEAASASSSS
ncbi:MAG TPA: PP0621 family protein [Thermoanaerobaculia bacterium]|nr:PP0621 family protein [Thermoanaerobaculia bacterium]